MAGSTEHVISVEELLSRKINFVATEAGETSRGRDISGLQMRTIELQDEEACELKKEFEKLREAGDHLSLNSPNGGQRAIPKIQKVPLLLRDHQHFAKYFEPRIVALGPIHHGTEKYQPAEKYKLIMTNCFVKESGKDDEVLYNVVKKNIKQLRQCFQQEVTKNYSDQALAWMLFVDGCAILQSMHCAATSACKDWKMKYDLMAFGTQDLFLLENQLPYQLLQDLMDSSANKGELEKSITKFMYSQIILDGKAKPSMDKLGITETPIHLLDRLRTLMIISKSRSSTPGEDKGREDKIKEEQDGAAPPTRKSKTEIMPMESYSYRNVVELRSAGIHVKPSDADLLTTITFKKPNHIFSTAKLILSPIKVDDSMGPKFLNLIAYEMCPDFYNKLEITSYILFLDSLIDNIHDVTRLRNEGVLTNHLGSDEEVARLFNEIGTDLVPDPEAYREVRNDIQTYYNSKLNKWIAEARHEHCRTPWTVLAVSAAILILGLTFLQTWFAFKDDVGNSRPRVRP
ncbi:UPF0481 protein At3g47200-like [Carya illinoinensis]|uniref:Uncharacterized protein n=1 Tax=Carya illinoinensis TaxID=32201 RepID=A0A8T1PF63_CARIL|nr:UPF0481 protein At3g47200-like [Carya illinoinensis]KAG6642889.1 hypothetical protein CIPAW_09G171900 [Carya illinoinensis]